MRKGVIAFFALALGVVAAVAPAMAHHSFAAEFDANKPVTLKGKLTQLDWLNPHGWLHLDVTEPDGKVVNWAVEAGAPNALVRRGLRKTDFPIGSEIIVKGYRAKNDTPTASGCVFITRTSFEESLGLVNVKMSVMSAALSRPVLIPST